MEAYRKSIDFFLVCYQKKCLSEGVKVYIIRWRYTTSLLEKEGKQSEKPAYGAEERGRLIRIMEKQRGGRGEEDSEEWIRAIKESRIFFKQPLNGGTYLAYTRCSS